MPGCVTRIPNVTETYSIGTFGAEIEEFCNLGEVYIKVLLKLFIYVKPLHTALVKYDSCENINTTLFLKWCTKMKNFKCYTFI